jgi:hypothetical protein
MNKPDNSDGSRGQLTAGTDTCHLLQIQSPWIRAPTVGIAATGFCYPGGILQVFIDKISKFFIDKINKFFIDKISKFFIDKISKFRGCQGQQSDRFKQNSSSTSTIIYIVKIFKASPSGIVEFVQIGGPRDKSRKSISSSQIASQWIIIFSRQIKSGQCIGQSACTTSSSAASVPIDFRRSSRRTW